MADKADEKAAKENRLRVFRAEGAQALEDAANEAIAIRKNMSRLKKLAALYQGARDDTLTYSKERIKSILAAPPAPDRSARLVATIWDDWNRPLDRNLLRKHAEQLKSLAEKLETQGVRVFFFEMPYPSRLNGSVFATTTREVLADAIPPDDKHRLTLDYPFAEMRSEADGVHLDDRSSVIFAAALERAIHEKLARD